MIELLRVEADDVRLGRLLQLYMHEWSDRLPVPIGPDALYTYPSLPLYRSNPSRGAWLFLDAQQLPIGFVLTMRDDDGCTHVEEFFVLAGARRRGIGLEAAGRVLATRPGPWSLTVRPENPTGLAFWRRALSGADERQERGDDGIVRTRLSTVVAGG
ncbi:MAG: GNAT family N-acetyltransferase [Polyangiales bacterium]